MKVVLWAVPLIPVGVLPSPEVVASVVSSVVSLGRCSVPIDVHRDGSVIHPARGVGRVILGCVLPLRAGVVPL